jgi:hypothetical protein
MLLKRITKMVEKWRRMKGAKLFIILEKKHEQKIQI